MYGSDSCDSMDQLMTSPPSTSIGQSFTEEEKEEGEHRGKESVRVRDGTEMEEIEQEREDGVRLLV